MKNTGDDWKSAMVRGNVNKEWDGRDGLRL